MEFGGTTTTTQVEKFGQVFQENGKPIKDCFISTWTMKWTDSNGDIHPAMEVYGNKRAAIQYSNVWITDKNRERAPFTFTFDLPLRIGEMGDVDVDQLEKVSKSSSRAGKILGLTKNEKKQQSLAEVDALTGLTTVQTKAGNSAWVNTVFAAFLALDDYFTSENVFTFRQLEQVASTWIDMMNGNKRFGKIGNGNLDMDQLLQKFGPIFERVHHETVKTTAETKTLPDYILQDFVEYFRCFNLESSMEWSAKSKSGSTMVNHLQEKMHEVTAGGYVILETNVILDGTRVSSKVRNTFLFQQFRTYVAKHIALVNDLMSFEREFANGETHNRVYLLHVEKDLAIQEALEEVTREVNEVISTVVEIGDLLKEIYPDDEHLQRYIYIGKAFCSAYIQWFSYSKRYLDPDACFNLILKS